LSRPGPTTTAASHQNDVVETKDAGFSYLFDIEAQRLIAAWGLSKGKDASPRAIIATRRATHSQISSAGSAITAAMPSPTRFAGRTDINLVPQRRCPPGGPAQGIHVTDPGDAVTGALQQEGGPHLLHQRRRVRAQAVATSTEQEAEAFVITRSVYQDALEEVNDIQLSLEIVAKDVETNANVLRYAKEIFQGVRTMEEYINEMVDEWEHLHAKFEGDPPTARTSIVPKFNDLLGAYKTSQFRPLFVHAYYQTIENVRASMTDGGTLRWQLLYGPRRTSGHS